MAAAFNIEEYATYTGKKQPAKCILLSRHFVLKDAYETLGYV